MRLVRALFCMVVGMVVLASTPPAAAQTMQTISIHLTLADSIPNWDSQPPIGPAANAQFRVESKSATGPVFSGVTDADGRASVTVPADNYIFVAEAPGGYRRQAHLHGNTTVDIVLAPPIERASLRVKVVNPCGTVPRTAQVIVGAGIGMWGFNYVDRNDEVHFDFAPSGEVLLTFGYVYGEKKWITVAPTGTTAVTMEMNSGLPCGTTTTTTVATTTTAPPSEATTTTTVEDDPEATTTTPEEPATTTSGVEPTAAAAAAPPTIAPVPTTTAASPPLPGERSAPGARSTPTRSSTSTSTSSTTSPSDSDGSGGGGAGRTVALAAGLGGPTVAGLGFAALRYRRRQPLP